MDKLNKLGSDLVPRALNWTNKSARLAGIVSQMSSLTNICKTKTRSLKQQLQNENIPNSRGISENPRTNGRAPY